MKPVAGRVAFVTGASGGIGQRIAVALAQEGLAVAIHYLDHVEGARQALMAVKAHGGKELLVSANSKKKGQCDRWSITW